MKMSEPRTVRRRRRMLVGASLVLGMVLMAACGGTEDSSEKSTAAPTGEPRTGGVLRAMAVTEPRTLDPATIVNAVGFGELVANSLYGTLVHNHPDSGALVFDLAEAMESPDGGTTWTLTLRPDIEFSDGSPLNAEAVRYNWQRAANPEVGSTFGGTVAAIVDYDVVDETTLTVTLAEPQANFPASLVTNGMVWIASPAALERGVTSFDENPVGAGPFELKSWSRGGQIELVRNKNYHEHGKPYLDGITLSTVADASQRVDSVIAGDTDLVPSETAQLRTKAAQSDLQVHQPTINGGDIIAFNTQKPPFDDVRARQAVSMAIDMDVLDDVLNQGDGEVMDTLFGEDQPFYAEVALRETDTERAQELFDELAAEGKPVAFTISAGVNAQHGEAIQTQLRDFENVEVEIDKIEVNETTVRLMDGNFQALTVGTAFIDPDAWAYSWFHSESPVNPGKLKDDKTDSLVEEARTVSDPAVRKEKWTSFQEMLAEQVPFLWTVRPERYYVAGPGVGGITSYGMASMLTADLWLDQ